MRKKLGIALCLILLALVVTALVVVMLPPAEPPLRVGMSQDEVERIYGNGASSSWDDKWQPTEKSYYVDPDRFGNWCVIFVGYDNNRHVTSWEVSLQPRTSPPWLDRAMKWAEW